MTVDWWVEPSPELADWLGVAEVLLVREDRLPDGGGRKRRSLESFAATVSDGEEVHVLSYAGSHTVMTLARLLPNNQIVLYGAAYDGGAYRAAMTRTLDQLPNVRQHVGPSWRMFLHYGLRRLAAETHQRFMRIGGSLGHDPDTTAVAAEVCGHVGDAHHHVVSVASGDLFQAIAANTDRVTGVLTQPPLVRLIKRLQFRNVAGLRRTPLAQRVDAVLDAQALTGELWDPVFVGSALHHVQATAHPDDRLCLWVTCPTGIAWMPETLQPV